MTNKFIFDKKFLDNNYNFINSQNSESISKLLLDNINNNSGWYLNRFGGSDFEAITEYFRKDKDNNNYDLNFWKNLTEEFNGYFDKSSDDDIRKQNFIKYLEKLNECYKNANAHTVMFKIIDKNFNDKAKSNFYKSLCGDKILIDFHQYIERIYPFLHDFKIWGEGKKILIISPFSESIKYQTKSDRINNLINNYTFPNFKLVTYNTPITYNKGLSDLENEVDTNNWLEQCKKMEGEISQLDFDVALLACASYATNLGNFISTKMNKKAINIGGALNVIFNIYGKRYDSTFFNQINNLSYRIPAFEKKNMKIL